MIGWENQGYTVEAQFNLGKRAVMLACNPKAPAAYATWLYSPQSGFYWGHYFESYMDAVKDFCRRTLEQIEGG